MLKQIWDKFKWALTHGSWLIAGIIALIDPNHIDEFAHDHPAWSSLILAAWAALLAWANKPRPSLLQQSMNGSYTPRPPSPPPPPKRAA